MAASWHARLGGGWVGRARRWQHGHHARARVDLVAASSGIDATVVAIPFYFGSMEAERRWLQRRAEAEGPSPADYDRPDPTASLAMGVASLVVPLVVPRLLRHVTPGRGRYGRALVGTALAAVAATTVADRLARQPEVDERSRRVRRWARKVARVGGPVAVATGGLAVTTTFADLATPERMWVKGQRHDRGAGPVAWALAVGGWDLIYYWNHRMMHEVRAMWAIHVVHHSSEHYNLSTALRQPVADALGVWVPYGLLSRVGIRPGLVAQARGINLLYQYWIHTDTIRSIGEPGEAVLNTPSHHRVHHGSNHKYLDRNHGSILINRDKLYGTFQREEEPVVYGLTKNIHTYAPPMIATHEYRDILRDVAASTSWRDRLSFVLRGPGWAYRRHAEDAAAAATAG
jgi:sterol desaturase/sphingolipid hydroxylase (fatty acid hydroxylase superfamily)